MGFDPLDGDPLRPHDWDEFVGQGALKERLIRVIDASMKDFRPPPHMLIVAPPGYGKTTLARIIAKRLGAKFEVLTMPVGIEVLVRLLIQDEFDGVLLLDEIHRGTARQQEDLLTLIEGNYIQYLGEKYQVGYLTVIGATTEPKKLIKPLVDRFPLKPTIDPYTEADMHKILRGMVQRIGYEMDEETADKLARATAGTPRRARDMAFAARDLEIVNGKVPTAEEILDHLRVDEDGLGVEHWRYLSALSKLGGRAGLRPLASLMGENDAVVEEIEQLLLDRDFITLTDRGRALRGEGHEKLRERRKENDAK